MIALLILSIICIIGISLAISFNKEVLILFNGICNNFRGFVRHNSGFFTVFFLISFFIEQLILIVLVYFFDTSPVLQTFIGIFALVVVTTATSEKFIWEYKFNYTRSSLIDFSNKIKNFRDENKKFIIRTMETQKECDKLKKLCDKLKQENSNLKNRLK